MSIAEIQAKILPILTAHHVSRAGLFGSAARGELRPDSDVDILVELNSDISLLKFIGIKQELEASLGRKVDLVEYRAIKPALKNNILKEQISFL